MSRRTPKSSARDADVDRLTKLPGAFDVITRNMARFIRKNAHDAGMPIDIYVATQLLPKFADDPDSLRLFVRAIALIGAQEAAELLADNAVGVAGNRVARERDDARRANDGRC